MNFTEENKQFLATHDFLTRLPNRHLFNDHLEDAINTAKQSDQHAVLFMDLDSFKNLNDSFSHKVGDQVLQQLASRLNSIVGKSGSVARLSGGEFTILINRIEDISNISKQVLTSFKKPFNVGNEKLNLTTSIGIAIYPDDHTDAHGLIRCADAAMAHAKKLGRNNIQFFTPEINHQIETRLLLERDMQNAIANEQFELYYQPQIDSKDGSITGLEALIRWQHPEKGMLLPSDFIPFSEESGLIIELGHWVIITACQQAYQWNKNSDTPLNISINISVQQLMHPNFIDSVASIVEQSHVNPNYITLEITENIMLRQPELAIKILNTIKEMGFKLSIDDFGTGYSSLQYLRLLPLDELKIDQSFVQDIHSKEGMAIINTICDLGHSMGLSLLAEGVEDAKVLPLLQKLGCRHIQGFLCSIPLNVADAARFISLNNQPYPHSITM